jgi:hypothetical protein
VPSMRGASCRYGKVHRGQQQRATCPQCHSELVRHPGVEDNTWKVEEPTPLADEELRGGRIARTDVASNQRPCWMVELDPSPAVAVIV